MTVHERVTPTPPGSEPRGPFSAWRHEFGAAALIVVALAVIVGVGWFVYNRPAHAYSVGPNSATWTSDVKLAIAESKPTGPLLPRGPLRDLPGVGTITSVLVNKGPGNRVAVFFVTNDVPAAGESGLAYLRGYPPYPDTCNVHLSGPWWQIGVLNESSNDCARGFHFTGGG
jgi:hypothetical protein